MRAPAARFQPLSRRPSFGWIALGGSGRNASCAACGRSVPEEPELSRCGLIRFQVQVSGVELTCLLQPFPVGDRQSLSLPRDKPLGS
jgi:hypothetical protein